MATEVTRERYDWSGSLVGTFDDNLEMVRCLDELREDATGGSTETLP